MIESLASILFPRNTIHTKNGPLQISALDARIDRYILFRARWEPEEFGSTLYYCLRSVGIASENLYFGRTFSSLSNLQKVSFLEKLSQEEIPVEAWPDGLAQKVVFAKIHRAISEGLLADPGYGGNADGLGWTYSNFMEAK